MFLTGDPKADQFLAEDDLALLIGMLLDQQVPMETAFAGPARIRDRLGYFDAATIAATDIATLTEVFRQPPAVHRFPGSMAERTQRLCAAVVADWGGDAAAIWTRGEPDGAEVLRRLVALPGFGQQKARILLALLGKRRGLSAPGWRDAAAPYGEAGSFLSAADIVDADSLAAVRANKRAARAKAAGAPSSGR